jgi:hypothetical protein
MIPRIGNFTLICNLIMIVFPYNTAAQWEQTNGPFYRPVKAIFAKDTCIFASVGGQLYISYDRGINWSTSQANIGSITSFESRGTKLFAGSSTGIFLSVDNGITWTNYVGGSTNCLKYVNDTLYRGESNGVGCKYNEVANWAVYGLGGRIVYALAFGGNNVFAATDSGVYKLRRTDNLVYWDIVALRISPYAIDACAIAFFDSYLFAGSSYIVSVQNRTIYKN